MGGGVIRDLLLGITPPGTFQDPIYAVVALLKMCIRDSAVALVDLEGLAHVGDSVFQDVLVMLPLLHLSLIHISCGASS